MASIEITNENACPNSSIGGNNGRNAVSSSTNKCRQWKTKQINTSPLRSGPSVAKLAAIFDANSTQDTGHADTSNSKPKHLQTRSLEIKGSSIKTKSRKCSALRSPTRDVLLALAPIRSVKKETYGIDEKDRNHLGAKTFNDTQTHALDRTNNAAKKGQKVPDNVSLKPRKELSTITTTADTSATAKNQELKEQRRMLLLQERLSQKEFRQQKVIDTEEQHMYGKPDLMPCADATKTKLSPSVTLDHAGSPCTNGRAFRLLQFASRVILLVLALYEVQHYYFISPAATVFDIVSELTGWSDIFHVGFVVAFTIRALFISSTMAAKHVSGVDERSRVAYIFQTMFFFLFIALCWAVLLPVFKECASEANNASHFCFFVEKSSEKLKGKVTEKINISAPRYSALDLLAREWSVKVKFLMKSTIKGRVMREIKRGLWRPFAFHGRLKKLFMILRWAKFIAPLVGTCNKFRGHILDMIKKRRQHIKSKAAQKRWNELLDAVSKQSKLERIVLKMQRRFRERREFKAKRRQALMLSRHNTSNKTVALKINKTLVEEQQLSRSKLKRMEILDNQRKMKRQVSQDERQNITKHKESERKLKKRLLLSPKTSFAVGWKYFTVACVALEISQIVFAPMLSGKLKKMPLDQFIFRVLNTSSHCGEKIKKGAAPSIFVPVINSLGNMTCRASSLRETWLLAFVSIVNTIFFLDVFITFFTGELTSSGVLVPKPFFTRYVIPGIGLQLIVNPTMVEISRLVKQVLVNAMHIGPSLCFHLLLACIPFAALCCDKLLDMIFDFVERQNQVVVK